MSTTLSRSLLDFFDEGRKTSSHDDENLAADSPALSSHPSILRQMEEEVKKIVMGTFDKDFFLEKNLE